MSYRPPRPRSKTPYVKRGWANFSDLQRRFELPMDYSDLQSTYQLPPNVTKNAAFGTQYVRVISEDHPDANNYAGFYHPQYNPRGFRWAAKAYGARPGAFGGDTLYRDINGRIHAIPNKKAHQAYETYRNTEFERRRPRRGPKPTLFAPKKVQTTLPHQAQRLRMTQNRQKAQRKLAQKKLIQTRIPYRPRIQPKMSFLTRAQIQHQQAVRRRRIAQQRINTNSLKQPSSARTVQKPLPLIFNAPYKKGK